MNILQIDLEPWYCDLPMDRWEGLEENIVENTSKILDILSKSDNKATFFILSDVAKNHPELIANIKNEGHEIGSHGTVHEPLYNLTPDEFEDGLINSVETLTDLGIKNIEGYRAPQFSLDQSTAWALDILEDHGFRYDSSIFPVKTQLYGVEDAPRQPYQISSEDVSCHTANGLHEIPLSTYRLPGVNKNIPVAGGFYLRAFPYQVLKQAIKRIDQSDAPAVCYLHPWELGPEMPRVPEYSWYHYFRNDSTKAKFSQLLTDFDFGTTVEWLDENAQLEIA